MNLMSDKKGGSNRDWGYASYDVDRYDDYSDSNLQYTSYEKSGSVNRYSNTLILINLIATSVTAGKLQLQSDGGKPCFFL